MCEECSAAVLQAAEAASAYAECRPVRKEKRGGEVAVRGRSYGLG